MNAYWRILPHSDYTTAPLLVNLPALASPIVVHTKCKHDETMKTKNPAAYEGLIDATQFGVVANYLKNPDSTISFLLHVKEPGQLAALAAQLDQALDSPVRVRAVLDPLLRDGSLQVSARMPLPDSFPGIRVDPNKVQPKAECQVIWMEPFYLVHTPGLFEGKRQLNTTHAALKPRQEDLLQSETQEPPQRKTSAYTMSH
jgi:hypothetical protein